MLILRNNPERL